MQLLSLKFPCNGQVNGLKPCVALIFNMAHGVALPLLILLFALQPAAAFEFFSQLSDADAPWHITADRLSYADRESVVVAEGDVVVSKKDKRISADYARFNQKSMVVTAKGHVVMSVGDDVLTADVLEINLATEEGFIHNGSYFLAKDNFHIKGDTIEKTGPNSFRVSRACITTCDGEKPAWKITGRDLNLTIEGYGVAYHTTFWVKSLPVMYAPFIAFPVKLKRQTGLLPPQLGSSSRRGFEYLQPFFWAISDSADATLYEHYMDLRGNKIGSEFRFVLSPESKGTLMFDYLEDREVDDGTGTSSSDWGYDDGAGGTAVTAADILRPNSDRYWFRMKQDQEVPAGFSAKLDLDVVSDQDYLQEFKNGYTGFRDSKNYFNDVFQRDIDDYNETIRLNRFNLDRQWTGYALNAEIRWYDNVVSRRQGGIDTSVQRLPAIRFDATKQSLLRTPLYFTLENEYAYLFREDALTENGVTQTHRADLHPRLYWPVTVKPYLSLEPSIGARGTYWRVEEHDPGAGGPEQEESLYRGIADGRLDLSSEIYRIFKTEGQTIDRLKHTLKPQISYSYIPDQNQDEYPYFDAVDRINAQNQITYSMTNLMIYRSRRSQPGTAEADHESSPFDYHQFLRLYLEQRYDFNEADEDNPAKWKNGKTREPFSPVYGKIDITPQNYYSLSADAEWSTYRNDWVTHNVAASLWDRRGDRLLVEHRYANDDRLGSVARLESLHARLSVQVTDRLSAAGEYERDLYHRNDLLSGIDLIYNAQCWSLKLAYTREDEDETYSFMIGLYGLGDIGSEL